MKKTGGKAIYNRSTGEWESQPVKYVEFHCTPEEWKKLGNGKFILIKDWILSHMNWYTPDTRCIFENFSDFKELVNDMVHEIVCDRYNLDITCSKNGGYKIEITGAPFPFYVSSQGDIELWTLDDLEGNLVEVLTTICKGIFGVIDSVKRYKNVLYRFQSGEYMVHEVVFKSNLIKW